MSDTCAYIGGDFINCLFVLSAESLPIAAVSRCRLSHGHQSAGATGT